MCGLSISRPQHDIHSLHAHVRVRRVRRDRHAAPLPHLQRAGRASTGVHALKEGDVNRGGGKRGMRFNLLRLCSLVLGHGECRRHNAVGATEVLEITMQ